MKVKINQESWREATSELESAFLKGLEENKQKLLRICSTYTSDQEEKKDLFQEVLVNIWKSMASFKGNCSLSTWMYRITLNVCINMQTKLTKEKRQFRNMDSVKMSQYKESSSTEEESPLLMYLRSCIKTMNDANKAVITLYLEELPYKEIAAVTGLTENHVAVKIKRIKKKLLNCINEKL
ncbi:MAG: RNA polymerase sigma factor [Bacteroidota bacterium]